MITMNDFLTTIFKNILNMPIVSPTYKDKYGISRNSFTYYIRYNKKLSKKLSNALIQIILDNIDDEYKENDIINYLSTFLTKTEKRKMKTIQDIITTGILKFTSTTNKNKNKIRVISYKDILRMNLGIRDFFADVMKLDSEEIENLTQEHAGELEQWVMMAIELPETWRGLFDENNKIIGYWNFKPLFENEFLRAKKGLLFDGELSVEMMPVLVPGIYNIYFIEICLSKKYKGTAIFRIVLNSIASAIEQLAQREIYIDEMCTLAYTTDGKRICKSLGLQYHTKHVDCGDIYYGSIKNLLEQPFCRNFYTLKRLYDRHFKTLNF